LGQSGIQPTCLNILGEKREGGNPLRKMGRKLSREGEKAATSLETGEAIVANHKGETSKKERKAKGH